MAKKRNKKQSSDDEEIKIDFKEITKIFSNKKIFNSTNITILLLIIVIATTLFIRIQPLDAPVTEDWARNSVTTFYRNNVAQQVNAQFPNLPQQNKNAMIDKEYASFVQANKAQIDADIAATTEQFRAQLQYDYEGKQYTYLGDLDSYFFLRYARNIEEKGSVCDEIGDDDKCIDTYSMAPAEYTASSSLHSSTIVAVHKTANVFGFNIPLMQASWLVPIIIGTLTAFFAFFLGRKVGGNLVGFFGALFIALHPILISRSSGSDTDGWNVFFPVVIMWLFLLAFDSKNKKEGIIYGILTAFSIFLFSRVWGGWWFMYDLIIGTLIIQIVYTVIKELWERRNQDSKKIKKWLLQAYKETRIKISSIVLGTIIVAHFILQWILTGSLVNTFKSIWGAITGPLFFSTFKAATEIGGSLWPNVLTTVAEFNAASLGDVVGQVGGRWLFVLAMMGVVFFLFQPKNMDRKDWLFLGGTAILYILLTTTKGLQLNRFTFIILMIIPIVAGIIYATMREKKIAIHQAIILSIWFAGTIYASTQGLRFVLLLVPAFGITLSMAILFLYNAGRKKIASSFNMPAWIPNIVLIILFALLLFNPISNTGAVTTGYYTARAYVPSMNDGWYDTLTEIRDESASDAIINSWWDFGHWFKYVADRRVTLDGGTQGFPPLHWLGKTLVTNNTDMAVGTLRYLDCGSNAGFDTLNELTQDDSLSITILNQIIPMHDRAEAKELLLENGLTSQQAEAVLEKTHCAPPENYFITSEDMVGKAGVWAHFGKWSFIRAELLREAKISDEETFISYVTGKPQLGLDAETARTRYREIKNLQNENEENTWISPWPQYITQRAATCGKTDNTSVVCTLNLNVGSTGPQNIRIEKALVNLEENTATFTLGFYDRTTNIRVGENTGVPAALVVAAEEGFIITNQESSSFPYDLLINEKADGTYDALLTDPLLTTSTFTKLFYLDGKYMEDYYEKFSQRNTINGQKIIVWKIKWP